MKKTRIGMVLVIFLTIWAIFMNTKTVGAPALTYVYSESMEPLIQVNDGFFVALTMKSEVERCRSTTDGGLMSYSLFVADILTQRQEESLLSMQ